MCVFKHIPLTQSANLCVGEVTSLLFPNYFAGNSKRREEE